MLYTCTYLCQVPAACTMQHIVGDAWPHRQADRRKKDTGRSPPRQNPYPQVDAGSLRQNQKERSVTLAGEDFTGRLWVGGRTFARAFFGP